MTKRPNNRSQAIAVLERAKDSIPYPTVVEMTHRGEHTWDVFGRLLKDRIVFLGTDIDDEASNVVIAQFLFLESEDPDKEITLYINSLGGAVTSGLAIYDAMQQVRCAVSTTCLGIAASTAAVLLACGTKGERRALPHSRVVLHQPLGDARGPASDIEIQSREIRRMKDALAEVLAKATGQSTDRITKDMHREFHLSAESAKEYGIIDCVMLPTSWRGPATQGQ